MNPAVARPVVPSTVIFTDGLGERRYVIDPAVDGPLEVLCLRNELTAVPSFEFALRERVSRLAGFRHASFARIRSVDRLNERETMLALTCDHTPGARLSDILAVTDGHVPLEISAALCVIRQLAPALTMLHETARDASHGALNPEHIIITPDGRAVIVEYVLGAALEQLKFSHDRYWRQLRIALPRSAGPARFDHRVDVVQLGMVALALILGRPIREEEYPSRIGDVLASAWAISAQGGLEPLPPGLKSWIGQALQLDLRHAFVSASEARVELERVIGMAQYAVAPSALGRFLEKYLAYQAYERALMQPVAPPAATPSINAPKSTSSSIQAIPAPLSAVSAMPLVTAAQQPRAASPVSASSPVPQPLVPHPPAPDPQVAQQQVPLPRPSAVQPAVAQPQGNGVVAHQSEEFEPDSTFTARSEPNSESTTVDDLDELAMTLPGQHATRQAATEPAPKPLPAVRPRPWRRAAIVSSILVACMSAGIPAARWLMAPPILKTGTLVVNTNPSGAAVLVDGQGRGAAPLTLALAPGSHTLELRGSGEPRRISFELRAGMQVSQYIEMPKALPKTEVARGRLDIRTQPPGARVAVDGVSRGIAPLTVSDLVPGRHAVEVANDQGTARQTVMIEAGAASSLLVPITPVHTTPSSGWMTVSAPVDLQIFEGGRLLGASGSDRITMSAGAHEIQLVNEAFGFRALRNVQVSAGKGSMLSVKMPNGTIALNAVPWAEVWIDGEKVGETPIGNLAVPIGPHEVVFRHPTLGEQRHTVSVTLATPARLSVDLRKR